MGDRAITGFFSSIMQDLVSRFYDLLFLDHLQFCSRTTENKCRLKKANKNLEPVALFTRADFTDRNLPSV